MIEILLPALLAGLGLAMVAGPLGSFMIWRRMAYFGDTLAHSALLGIALALTLEIHIYAGIALAGIIIAMALSFLYSHTRLASDSLLGILSHTSLALGLISVSFFSAGRVDLLSFLVGDLLAVSYVDVGIIYAIGIVSLAVLAFLWRPLLLLSVDEELAFVEGVRVRLLRLGLMMILALVIAIALKVVGVLLITALLIIPAATARRFARSPEAMAIVAIIAGMLSVAGGILTSWQLDVPAGPAIVICSSILFACSLAGKSKMV